MSNQIVFESNRLVICWADPEENEYEYWGHFILTDKEAEVLSEAGTELFEVHDDGSETIIDDVAHAIERNVRICAEIGDLNKIGIHSLSRANRFHLSILYGSEAVDAHNDSDITYDNLDDLVEDYTGLYNEHVFYTKAEREAFLQGIEAGNGWDNYEVIEQTDYITSESKKENPDYINTKWHIDDIKDRNAILTDDDAREIAHIMERRHDAEVGICWDVIDTHIDMYLLDKDDKRIAEIITRSDGIEIHAVHIDKSKRVEFLPETDGLPVTHYSVYGHLKEGGIDWLRDFKIPTKKVFDPSALNAIPYLQAINFAEKFNLPVTEY